MWDASIIFLSYLGLGRVGGIVASLLFGLPIPLIILLMLVLDFGQISMFGMLIEATHRQLRRLPRFNAWLEKKRTCWGRRLEQKPFWRKLSMRKDVLVSMVSIVPVRGCGVLSACVLAFTLGYTRVRGTVLIMAGSVIGTVATLLLAAPLGMIK